MANTSQAATIAGKTSDMVALNPARRQPTATPVTRAPWRHTVAGRGGAGFAPRRAEGQPREEKL